jgi:3,4-dihydroxy 2-butanone 4-phosphate synthase/GTP cyclohydrolase II
MTHSDPVTALHTGNLIVMIDDHVDEGGAELWLAAEGAEALTFARLVRHTSGFVTVAIPAARSAALGLPAMIGADVTFTERQPAQAITCDAAEGVSTGISAADRALTARLLADPAATPDHFTRPGHLVPLRVREGLTDINAPASAALVLCGIAQLRPAMVRCELVDESGALADAAGGVEFAHLHRLSVVVRRDLVQAEAQLARIA